MTPHVLPIRVMHWELLLNAKFSQQIVDVHIFVIYIYIYIYMSAKYRESIVLMNIIDILKKDTSCLPHECEVWAVASEYKNWRNFLPL